MGFDYHRAKSQAEHGSDSMWTSYSDLFLMLSIVFLLLYVTASLKTQTSSIQKQAEYQRLAQKASDLEQQIQVYNTLKEEQIKQSSEQEQEVYNRLMDKLVLLKEEAKNEKEQLRRQAKENEEKELALNEYQQMIRNIINSNILAKTKIKNREELITNKEQKIGEQRTVIANKNVELAQNQEEIEKLNLDIEAKTRNLNANRQLIKEINSKMNAKIAVLTEEQKKLHGSKEELAKKVAALRRESERKVAELESKNRGFISELSEAQKSLELVSGELEQTRSQYSAEVARLKGEHEARMARERGVFEESLKRERMSGEERAKRIAAYAQQSKAREAELAGKLGELEKRASAAEAEKGRAVASLQGLQKEKEGLQRNMASLSSELKNAQEIANAKKILAQRIQDELRKAGLKGTVDGKTGDVTLAFGEEYFDTGSSDLKPTMRKTLEKFLPGYSKSLFKDGKIAEKIENVEIIGFASSTYKGRYVAPDSLRPEDQEAVNYNLKLSFNRANAIFKHIFDTKQMRFEHQKELLPRIKVVGRGYLPDGKTSEDFRNGMPEKEFCALYNCKSAQKVIIKFKLKD
jgi:outer membrane protein OmpA-like peptidoglycan-associated protein